MGGGGGDTLAGTTLETTLAGTGAGQRDVCCTRHTVLPHWQHCGSTHTHGVIADTTAVHTCRLTLGCPRLDVDFDHTPATHRWVVQYFVIL